jgi:hypothetical protein
MDSVSPEVPWAAELSTQLVEDQEALRVWTKQHRASSLADESGRLLCVKSQAVESHREEDRMSEPVLTILSESGVGTVMDCSFILSEAWRQGTAL